MVINLLDYSLLGGVHSRRDLVTSREKLLVEVVKAISAQSLAWQGSGGHDSDQVTGKQSRAPGLDPNN